MSEAPGGAGDAGPPEGPRRVAGLELLGEFRDSGLEEPSYLVRRPDGRVVRLSLLLYLVAAAADGRPTAAIADEVSAGYGRRVGAADVRFLSERKLAPAGVIGDGAPASGPPSGGGSALGLRLRARVVPTGTVRALAGVLAPLFRPPVVVVVTAALVALDAWILSAVSLGGLAPLLLDPGAMGLVLAVLLASAAFHECGHAAACRYGGGRPGAIGVGLFVVWPAFFSDVTDAYRLGRAGRVRTDLGGVYFNALAVLAIAGAWALTGHQALLLAALLAQLEMLRQLVPLPRLDGYYVLGDLAGVPDLAGRVGPALAGIVRRGGDPRRAELRPAVRVAVAAYAVALVPLAGAAVVLLAAAAPRWGGLALETAGAEGPAIAAAAARLDAAGAAGGAARLALALLPVLGLSLMVASASRRLAATLARHVSRGVALAGAVAAAAGSAALLGVAFMPSGPPPSVAAAALPPTPAIVAPAAEPPPPGLSRGDARALNDDAYGLMLAGRHAEAVAPLRRAVAALRGAGPADPYEAYANYNLGASLLELGRCAEAGPPLMRSDLLQDRIELDRAFARLESCGEGAV